MCKISSPTILPLPLHRYRMDYRDLRRLSRRFWHRHRPTWCFIREYDPGFWADVWETLQEAHALRWTEEGAVVRRFPEVRDAMTQAQTLRVRHGGVQTSPVATREIGVQTEDWAREAAPEPAAPPPGGCWNCGSTLHGYTRCDRPRQNSFCFGCGERGATVRTCRRCGPIYERTQPYSAPRGPRDRQQPTRGTATRGSPY